MEGERSGGPEPSMGGLSAGAPPAGPGSPPGLGGGAPPLRQTLSAPAPLMDPAEDALDGEWPLSGPFNFDRWRDMIERCAAAFYAVSPDTLCAFCVEDARAGLGRMSCREQTYPWQRYMSWPKLHPCAADLRFLRRCVHTYPPGNLCDSIQSLRRILTCRAQELPALCTDPSL